MGHIPAHIQYQSYSRGGRLRRRSASTASLVSIGALIGLACFGLAMLSGLLR